MRAVIVFTLAIAAGCGSTQIRVTNEVTSAAVPNARVEVSRRDFIGGPYVERVVTTDAAGRAEVPYRDVDWLRVSASGFEDNEGSGISKTSKERRITLRPSATSRPAN